MNDLGHSMLKRLKNDPEIIREFLEESSDLLENVVQDLIHLESDPQNEESLNRVFCAVHTIKDNSSFLGFEKLVSLGHAFEDVRDALCEVSNMIVGHFKAKFAKTVHADEKIFNQSIPSIICGHDFKNTVVTDAPTYGMAFETEKEPFYVELALKKV